jgi:pimeloyl-ACP methyl ester carboxylesterase
MIPELDGLRYPLMRYEGRGFSLAYVRLGVGGVPLLCVHGWPETKRIWWRVIEPLAAAGFEVIVPDLRGFGDSDLAPDGRYDVPASSWDLHDLVTEGLGHERVVLCAGDLGGVVAQDFALRFPAVAERLILFNSPLPYDAAMMAGLRTRAPVETSDYYVRQGTDADGLCADLTSSAQRRRYIASFYTSRLWAHPGSFLEKDRRGGFSGSVFVDFHTEPFADAFHFRASLGAYEAVYREEPHERVMMARNPAVETLILFGASDNVIAPDFDRMAALVFPHHVGPFVVRDCGHFLPWEAPDVMVSATRSFCRDLL